MKFAGVHAVDWYYNNCSEFVAFWKIFPVLKALCANQLTSTCNQFLLLVLLIVDWLIMMTANLIRFI